jgi:DNA repair protein RecO (recombination protein O)
MLHTTGIVLRTTKYGETSVIADIFTYERGVATFIGGSVRTARSQMPYSLFQPMTVVDLVSYWRDTPGALHRLKEFRAAEVWQTIPFDLRRGAIALFMAEVCRKCLHEGEASPDLFDDLRRVLVHLDQSKDSVANMPLHFLLLLSAHLGFQPEVPDLEEDSAFFDLKEGVFSSHKPDHGQSVGPELTVAMLELIRHDLATQHEVVLTRRQRQHLLEHLLVFYQLHMPNFKDIHTPEVLEAVWG